MIKSFTLTLAIYAFFSITLHSQADLASEDCHTLTATFETLGTVYTPSTSGFSFILEKAILPNLWQKIEVVESLEKKVRFTDLPKATYRVTIISPSYITTQKTKLYHPLMAEEAGKHTANTFLSNTVRIDLVEDCETGHSIVSKRTVQTQQSRLTLYPNPTQGIVWIAWNATTPPKMLSIYNLTGKLLRSITPTAAPAAIDLSGFESGVYLLKAADGRSVIATERISVIR